MNGYFIQPTGAINHRSGRRVVLCTRRQLPHVFVRAGGYTVSPHMRAGAGRPAQGDWPHPPVQSHIRCIINIVITSRLDCRDKICLPGVTNGSLPRGVQLRLIWSYVCGFSDLSGTRGVLTVCVIRGWNIPGVKRLLICNVYRQGNVWSSVIKYLLNWIWLILMRQSLNLNHVLCLTLVSCGIIDLLIDGVVGSHFSSQGKCDLALGSGNHRDLSYQYERDVLDSGTTTD